MKQHTHSSFRHALAIVTLLVVSPLVALPAAQQRGKPPQAPTAAAPVATPAQPAPAATPTQAAPPAAPAQAAPVAAPVPPTPAPQAARPAPKAATVVPPYNSAKKGVFKNLYNAGFNVKVDVQVTDRLDSKVLSQETFTTVVQPASMARISRGTLVGGPPTSGALELTAEQIRGETVVLTIGSEFQFRPGLAGDKDPGVTVGQNVTSALVFGKPTTVIDMSTDSEGRRRFAVQVTVTKVAVE